MSISKTMGIAVVFGGFLLVASGAVLAQGSAAGYQPAYVSAGQTNGPMASSDSAAQCHDGTCALGFDDVVGWITPDPWFSDPDVRQQLGITDNQYVELYQYYSKAYAAYIQGVQGVAYSDLTPAQQMRWLEQLQVWFYYTFANSSYNVFTNDPERQLFLQAEQQFE